MEIQIKKRSKFLPSILLLFLIIGISCGVYFLYFQNSTAPSNIIVIESVKAEKGIIENSFDATGVIKATRGSLVTISTQVSGLIENIFVNVGEKITKGTQLLKIDNKELGIKRQELIAVRQKVQAELDTLRTLYPINLSEAKNAIILSEQQVTIARNIQNRAKKRTLSEEEKEQYDKALLESTTALSTAKSRKEQIEKEFSLKEKALKASVAQVQYQLNILATQNSYYSISSPIEGIIGNVFVQSGEYITASSKVATIVNPTQMEMWVYIDENDIASVKEGMRVSFKVDSLPNTVFHGNIKYIYPEPEIRNGVVYYKAVVPIKKEYAPNLYFEMTTQASLITTRTPNVLRIPNTAIKWINSKQTIYVEKDGIFIPCEVLLGKRGSTYSEVLSGINEGDTIATKIELL